MSRFERLETNSCLKKSEQKLTKYKINTKLQSGFVLL